jgi:hypothetical protein
LGQLVDLLESLPLLTRRVRHERDPPRRLVLGAAQHPGAFVELAHLVALASERLDHADPGQVLLKGVVETIERPLTLAV